LRRSPFTAVPGRLADLALPRRADLHVHTTASDGEYTAAQVGALARQAGLAAVAITDHDVLGAVDEARASAGDQVYVIAGVEISASFNNREVHLLSYFIRTDHAELNRVLGRVRDARRERFHDFVEKLAQWSLEPVRAAADRILSAPTAAEKCQRFTECVLIFSHPPLLHPRPDDVEVIRKGVGRLEDDYENSAT
jgi:hypothetical protein